MTQEKVKQLKSYYETSLVEKLSEILGFDASRFTASWNLSRTEVTLNANEDNLISTYRFIYTDVLTVSMQTQRLITNSNRQLTGIEVVANTIDFPTLDALNTLFATVLNSDMPDPTCECKDACTCKDECTCACTCEAKE